MSKERAEEQAYNSELSAANFDKTADAEQPTDRKLADTARKIAEAHRARAAYLRARLDA